VWACRHAVTAAVAGAVARKAPAHRWARCGSVCGMSTTEVETTQWEMRGSGRLTVMVARHEDGGGGPARWRCSEEWRAASMCHVSRGRIGGEEGHNQLRVEGLRVAITGGGNRRRFKPAQLAPVPGRWTTGGGGGGRIPGAPGRPVGVDKGKHRGARRCGTPR
jgi:hypothetical protein